MTLINSELPQHGFFNGACLYDESPLNAGNFDNAFCFVLFLDGYQY